LNLNKEEKQLSNKMFVILKNLNKKLFINKKLVFFFKTNKLIFFKYHIFEILNYFKLKQQNVFLENNKFNNNLENFKGIKNEIENQIIENKELLLQYNQFICFEAVVYKLRKYLKIDNRKYHFEELVLSLLISSRGGYYYFCYCVLNPPNIIIL